MKINEMNTNDLIDLKLEIDRELKSRVETYKPTNWEVVNWEEASLSFLSRVWPEKWKELHEVFSDKSPEEIQKEIAFISTEMMRALTDKDFRKESL